ncbi:MAG TPA: imidazole glycerol phosphate synthase subunit HisH [Casimicrobiaceae bacterium]|nr:imidazole glycerol phosphate synthase subunit HisH [Casimicrobiaceae bacterium]
MGSIVVIDYGTGNLRSVAKALAHVAPRASVVVSSDPAVIASAGRVVLPGQSAMPDCMRSLDASGLRGAVVEALKTRPFLGICLGLQMLFETSEEGPTAGLGALCGNVVRFRDEAMAIGKGERLKVPHMGWSRVTQVKPHPLWNGIAQGSRFYFAHSFHPAPADPALPVATASYPTPFTCAIARANIFAVQFHPEKSQRAGLQLLQNFIAWDGTF